MEVNLNQNEEYKETELGLLPEDWDVVSLGEIFMEVDKKTRKIKILPNERYKTILTRLYAKGIQLKEIKSGKKISAKYMYLLKEGDFIFSKINLRKGAFGFVHTEADGSVVSTEHPILKLDINKAHQNYIKFYLNQPYTWELFKRESKGFSGKERIKVREFMTVEIPLPPLSEQKKIAFVLSTVQEAIEKTEGVIKATKELKKSMMKHLFTYGPVPIEEAEHVPLKETELGLLPKDWEVVRLGDKGHFQYGYTTSATEEDTGTKFLRITDIKEDGVVNWDTVPYGIIDDNLQKFKLFENDILFARIGATTGKACIIEGKIPNAVFASYLIRFISNKELNPKYVFYFTQTREYQELVNAGKEGKLKKGLSATELKNFKIPLPPLSEQKKIASILSAIDQKIEAEENKKKALEDLFKSMLHDLMTAKVRVNHLEVEA